MKTFTKSFLLVFIIITMGSVSMAQDLSLNGRSAIELSLGVWGGASASNTVGSTGIQSSTGTSFVGGLGYSYWLRENLALTVTASLLSAQASATVNASNVTQQASTVIPLLLGIRYYVPEPGPDDNIRPYLSAAVGSYFGSEASNTLLSQQAYMETAIGGRLGVGVDFFLSNHFKLGAGVGYHLMANFENPVGARMNYNGGEFSLVAGYIF
jgi:outer membrane protein W